LNLPAYRQICELCFLIDKFWIVYIVYFSDATSFNLDPNSLDEDVKRVSEKLTALAATTSKTVDGVEERVHAFCKTLEAIKQSLPNVLDKLQVIQEQQLSQPSTAVASTAINGKQHKKAVVSADRSAQERSDAGLDKLVGHLAA
jgi:hypothetical protein